MPSPFLLMCKQNEEGWKITAAAVPYRGPQSDGKMLQLRSPNHVDFQRNSKGLGPIVLGSSEPRTHNSLGLGKYSYFYQSAK